MEGISPLSVLAAARLPIMVDIGQMARERAATLR